jgi:hypothetical protein
MKYARSDDGEIKDLLFCFMMKEDHSHPYTEHTTCPYDDVQAFFRNTPSVIFRFPLIHAHG